jgi:hypothetical protein
VELLSVARKGGSAKGGMTSATVDPTLGRPLLVVTANSQYAGLLDFLHGLKDLSFYTSVMNLKMYSRHLKDDRNRSASPAVSGELFVSLELSI